MCYIFKIHLAQRYSGRNVRKSDGTQFRDEHHQIKCRFIQCCWNSAKLLAVWFTAGCRVLLLWIFMLYVKKRCCPLLPNLPLIPQTTTSNNSYYPLLIIQIPPNAPFKLPLSKTHCIQHPPPCHSPPCPCPEVKIGHSVGVRAPQTPLTL